MLKYNSNKKRWFLANKTFMITGKLNGISRAEVKSKLNKIQDQL